MEEHKNIPILEFNEKSEFADWLEINHHLTNPYWLRISKKNSNKKSISYVDAREVALMYGWIDGLLNTVDENYYLLRFCHRRKKSNWSNINIEIAENLIRNGLMKDEGLAEVNKAKADGRYVAIDK